MTDETSTPAGPTADAVALLGALNTMGKHIYTGTVPEATIRRRRRKNKAARAARRRTRP